MPTFYLVVNLVSIAKSGLDPFGDLNEADYRSAFDALQILLWPYSYSKQHIDAAEGAHAKVRKGRGKLMIRDFKLNALEPGKQAGIDRMAFDVELTFP